MRDPYDGRPGEPKMLRRPGALAEFNEICELKSVDARIERLIKLCEEHPRFAPAWVERANQAMGSQRREEAIHAARRAYELDRSSYGKFSPKLQQACLHLLPAERPETAAATATAGELAVPAPRFVSSTARSRGTGHVAAKVARARALDDRKQRWDALHKLTREHPDSGEAWFGVAEASLENQRYEEAMAAAERAVALDRDITGLFSHKLQIAYRYHRAGLDEHGRKRPTRHRRRPGPGGKAGDRTSGTPGARPGGNTAARDAGSSSANSRGGAIGARGGVESIRGIEGIDTFLAVALEHDDPAKRLAALQSLLELAPHDESVLFHVARESALAGRHDDARRVARRLRTISAPRYKELFEWAERQWPNGADKTLIDPLSSPGQPTAASALPTAAPAQFESAPPAPARGPSFEPVMPAIALHAARGVTRALPPAPSEPDPLPSTAPMLTNPAYQAPGQTPWQLPSRQPSFTAAPQPNPWPPRPATAGPRSERLRSRWQTLHPHTQAAVALGVSLATGFFITLIVMALL